MQPIAYLPLTYIDSRAKFGLCRFGRFDRVQDSHQTRQLYSNHNARQNLEEPPPV
jgi:hypothetical protein